jgi:hypothetical protein
MFSSTNQTCVLRCKTKLNELGGIGLILDKDFN